MKEKMFCSKCGAADQSADSYCRQCGEWITDTNSRRSRFGRLSRESKITNMRVLQFISVGLSLASALIIINFLNGGDIGLLNLAVFCGFLVAAYQVAVLFIGSKVLSPKNPKDEKAEQTPEQFKISPVEPKNILNAADTGEFGVHGSVTENTTELLGAVPQHKYEN